MKALNITVMQAVNQFSELELLGAFVGGFTGEITADNEPMIKTGKVIRAVKNDEEWPALITIRTDETPPKDMRFYDTECISVIFPDQDTAYFKNLAAELQDYIDSIEPEKKSTAVLKPQCPQCGIREILHKYVWPEANVISFICISCKQFNNDSEEKYILADQISALKSELEVAHSMHIDHDRYKWEQLGFGSVDELIEHYLQARQGGAA